MQTKHYQTPTCKVVEMEVEAFLCASPSATTQEFDDLGTLEME
jgi:hypothetical protein